MRQPEQVPEAIPVILKNRDWAPVRPRPDRWGPRRAGHLLPCGMPKAVALALLWALVASRLLGASAEAGALAGHELLGPGFDGVKQARPEALGGRRANQGRMTTL